MLNLDEKLNLNDYTLILPSVSVGNVGQLSIDLLISTLNLRRAGRVFDTCFIPVVGPNPYDETSDDICTSLDLYVSDTKKLTVLQIRSPIVTKSGRFYYEIMNFIINYKICKVIILTSSFSHKKQDGQIKTTPFRYLATKSATVEFKQQFKDLCWSTLELKSSNEDKYQTVLQICGGGFTKTIFELFQKNNITCVVLLKFCSEGDNIPDAIELTNYFNQYLQQIPVNNKNACKLKFPASWKFLFGNFPSREIY